MTSLAKFNTEKKNIWVQNHTSAKCKKICIAVDLPETLKFIPKYATGSTSNHLQQKSCSPKETSNDMPYPKGFSSIDISKSNRILFDIPKSNNILSYFNLTVKQVDDSANKEATDCQKILDNSNAEIFSF